jgi:uncharacterized membrane protein
MKKISNWSIIGMLAGAIFAGGSFWRYYVMWPDLSQMVIGMSIGTLIIGISWLYNKQLNQGNTITAIENYLADKK